MDTGVWISIGVSGGMLLLQAGHLFYTAILGRRLDENRDLKNETKAQTEKLVDEKSRVYEEKLKLITHGLDEHGQRLSAGHGHMSKTDDLLKALALADKELKLEVLEAIRQLSVRVVTFDDLERWDKQKAK